MQLSKRSDTKGDGTMSSFVCSDLTILAIVEGMRKYGMIAKKKAESRDMAESLRFINEYMTTKRYIKGGEAKRWMVECDHRPVTATPRKFTDGETVAAVNCYLYQISTGPMQDLDFITLVSAVKTLRNKVMEANEATGAMRRVTRGGFTEYQELTDEYGTYRDVAEVNGWDL